MSRLYVLVPNIKKIRQFIKIFRKQGIPPEAMQIIYPDDHLELTHILDASLLETSDLLNSLIRGSILGGLLGLITGILIKLSSFEYINNYLVLAFFIFGIVFGAWTSSLIGVSVTNESLKEFEQALDNGKAMIEVNVKAEKEQALMEDIKLNYPDITIQSADPKN